MCLLLKLDTLNILKETLIGILIRRWSEESVGASYADRAIFAFTNMIRGINNSNLFTYSTKLMAATDDALHLTR